MATEYTIQGSVQHFFGCPSIPSKLARKLGDVHYRAIKCRMYQQLSCCQESIKQATITTARLPCVSCMSVHVNLRLLLRSTGIRLKTTNVPTVGHPNPSSQLQFGKTKFQPQNSRVGEKLGTFVKMAADVGWVRD